MKKTALMELIEWGRLRQRQLTQVNALDSATQYELMIGHCKALLELEREQICQAYEDGIHQELNEEINYTGETYYTETYK